MQWRLGAARRIQALIFLLSHRLDASRHFLTDFDKFRTVSDIYTLRINLEVKFLLKILINLTFSTLIKYLTLWSCSHLKTLHITDAFKKEEPMALFNLPLHHWLRSFFTSCPTVKNLKHNMLKVANIREKPVAFLSLLLSPH